MRIAVTGATGFLGKALTEALQARGDTVVAMTRDPLSGKRSLPGVEMSPWGGRERIVPPCDAVVNLAGESIAGRWTPEKKAAIRESRVEGTRTLVEAIGNSPKKPSILINASAVGFYGDRGEETLTEAAPPGKDWLAEVCSAWEAEALGARDLGLRVAMTRFGVVLGKGGGALKEMLPPFRMGAGGPYGSGRQWFPWIHRDDVVGLILHALDNPVEGPVNAVAPQAVRNAEFARALGRAVNRPALVPAPTFALKAILGEFATTLLCSQKVEPAVAQQAGYTFKHPELLPALKASV